MSTPIIIFCCTASTEYGFVYDQALRDHAVWEHEHRVEEEQRELEADTAARLAAPCECCGEWPDVVGALAIDGDAALCPGCRAVQL